MILILASKLRFQQVFKRFRRGLGGEHAFVVNDPDRIARAQPRMKKFFRVIFTQRRNIAGEDAVLKHDLHWTGVVNDDIVKRSAGFAFTEDPLRDRSA